MNEKWKENQNGGAIVATFIFVFYLLGVFFPNVLWGLHYPAFLTSVTGPVLIGIALIATLYFYKKNNWGLLEKPVKNASLWNVFWAFVAFVFYYKFPISNDVYGDSLAILSDRESTAEVLDPVYLQKILSLDFTNLKLGTGTTYGLVGWLSYQADMTFYEVFRLIGAVCGAGFVFFMLSIVHRISKRFIQRVLLTLVVFGAPLTLAFCGHIEIYAPVYMLLAVFWYVLIRYHEKRTMFWAVLLLFVAVLNFKFHVTGVLTLLVAIVSLLLNYRRKKEMETSWKQLIFWILTPVYVLGVFVYTCITKSTFAGRSFTEETITEVLFLPIKSNEAGPLDRYNLFSFNHVFDYFNIWFLWSSAALLIVLSLFIFFRKRIHFNHSLVQISGVAMLVYLPVFFVMNPLLGMTADWDLMSIPGVVLIVFAIILIGTLLPSERERPSFESQILTPIIGLTVLGLSTIFVNANREAQSKRLISSGTHDFRTYWIGSSTPIIEGVEMMESENQKKIALEKIVQTNSKYAIKGNDIEFSAIVNRLGSLYQNDSEYTDLKMAKKYYDLAFYYNPMLRKNIYDEVVVHFLLKDFKKAATYLPTLVAMKYPNSIKALRIAIHTSIEAEQYDDAMSYCKMLLKELPDDLFIQDVLKLLQNSEDKSLIKLKFRQK